MELTIKLEGQILEIHQGEQKLITATVWSASTVEELKTDPQKLLTYASAVLEENRE